jgi:AraC family transcriptional regulator, regulatory protein of adaptative response / methylated-DNA-[protein]-cysteine methyltransferase
MASDYIRIEMAIKFLEERHREQPGLDEIAHFLGLSQFHLQRLFRRWVGISPKRFLQFLTIEHAKQVLDETHDLLDATYETGLSSPGRLHDLFISIEAMTPGEFKHKGAGLVINYGIHPSPFGDCLLAVTERGICGLSFLAETKPEEALDDFQSRWPGARIYERPRLIKPYFDKIFPIDTNNRRRKITLFLNGTNFQIKVWEALIRIPPGHLCSYEDIARIIGNEDAVRAVGNAVAANPISFIIPCHRVIRKMGMFGDYHWGAARKKAIIGWESAQRFGEEAKVVK